ncbi:MAG: transcriptional repressor NrdR [Planctomycetes bacterium]|nr:transcriptional repressor NrdR [Planctomycetota bacterium]MCB9882876.1 transcriptional repressor NrdR [Planctomycetota bacterium]MCB9918952.1 transcriptional repressor NrdR [Planctomycetota bacterium]
MRCPYCKTDNDRVIDSRSSSDGLSIRRRRQCLGCSRRFTTYERVESTPMRVVKKDGMRLPFDRDKIRNGLFKACEKRPVSKEQIETIVDRVERQCSEAFDNEVPTSMIGNLVMLELRNLDQVAYVRFASVYREFKDASQFLEELRPLIEKKGGEAEEAQSS